MPSESVNLLVFETSLLTLGRAALFYACYRRIIRSIYADLKNIAHADQDAYDPDPVDLDIPMDSVPITPPPGARFNRNRQHYNPWHFTVARMCFSLCFSESCILFLLVMLQGLDILSPRSRDLNWKASLASLSSEILLLIPLAQDFVLSNQFCYNARTRSCSMIKRTVFAAVPFSLYLLALFHVPLPETLRTSDLFSAALSRLIVIGTLSLGLLSGFGAINTAWDFFPILFRFQRIVTSEQEIRTFESSLNRIRHDLQERREQQRSSQNSTSNGSWAPLMRLFRGNSESSIIRQEITGLEALEYQMDRKIESLRRAHQASVFSRTLWGRVYNWTGNLLAIYCIFRVFSSIRNIVLYFNAPRSTNPSDAVSYPDIITQVMAYCVSSLPFTELTKDDMSSMSRQISLVLVGLIILSSMRLVLRGVSKVLRLSRGNLGASLLLLILAQLMGIYLLANLVQLRTIFPPSATSQNLFTYLPDFEVFGSLFDWSFLLAATATALFRWMDEKFNSPI